MSRSRSAMSPNDPKREFAGSVVSRLQEAGFRALWAGGCVRDFLLGRAPQDYDVATNARPEQVRELFGQRRTHAVGASFGVILVRGPKEAGDVEIATFRRAAAGTAEAADWERTLHMLHLLQQPGFELAAAALLHGAAGSCDEYG